MMVLYGCLFYIFIVILSTSDPTSITFTLYYYLQEQNTPTRPLLLMPHRMEACCPPRLKFKPTKMNQ